MANKHIDVKNSSSKKGLQSDSQYQTLLQEIKSRLKKAQLRAAIVVNHELIQFYWEVGNLIAERQATAKWGGKLFDTLSEDLRRSFPDTEGFSKTNLKNMHLFVKHYTQSEFSQALPDQLTWTHHVVLIQMLEPEEIHIKQWYAEKVVENGWAYRELQTQIKSMLYNRQADHRLKSTNFKETLPLETSSLAQEMIKDPYKFHFLSLGKEAHEKDIHHGLVYHIKEFLMELGQGFALYGTHYPIVISRKRYEIDLLMYNTKLHAYFVIEIKRGEFDPRDAGQLNFYLSAIDDQLKSPQDNQTIGLVLCEKKDHIVAEYALRRINSPMGISEYELSKALPQKFESILPTTEEIEAELNQYSQAKNLPMSDENE